MANEDPCPGIILATGSGSMSSLAPGRLRHCGAAAGVIRGSRQRTGRSSASGAAGGTSRENCPTHSGTPSRSRARTGGDHRSKGQHHHRDGR